MHSAVILLNVCHLCQKSVNYFSLVCVTYPKHFTFTLPLFTQKYMSGKPVEFFFFVFLWTKTKSRSVNAKKNDLFCLRDGKESQLFLKQAASAGKVGSSGQSECRTRFVLPTGTASSIIILSFLCHRNSEKLWLNEPLEYRIYLADV